MEVTSLNLVEFFDIIRPKARIKGYEWIITILARPADAPDIYKELEQDFNSLHDLTYDNILFVLSSESTFEKNPFFHKSGEEGYVGYMCPYIKVFDSRIQNNYGDFKNYIDGFNRIDWKSEHAQSISGLKRKYNILENQIPGLFIMNIITGETNVIPISLEQGIYNIVKRTVMSIEEKGCIDRNFIVNPDFRSLQNAKLDITSKESVLKNIQRICHDLQSNRLYYGTNEDERNDYIRNALSYLGYNEIRDQTRCGFSPTKKGAGENDIQIRNNGEMVSLIESLIVNSVDQKNINSHIEKIYSYDLLGNEYNNLIVFCEAKKFDGFVERYLSFLRERAGEIVIVIEDADYLIDGISYCNSRLIKTVVQRNGKRSELYHFLIFMNMKVT